MNVNNGRASGHANQLELKRLASYITMKILCDSGVFDANIDNRVVIAIKNGIKNVSLRWLRGWELHLLRTEYTTNLIVDELWEQGIEDGSKCTDAEKKLIARCAVDFDTYIREAAPFVDGDDTDRLLN